VETAKGTSHTSEKVDRAQKAGVINRLMCTIVLTYMIRGDN